MIVNLNNIPQALQKAFDFLQKQNLLEAEKICTQILAEDPKNIQAHFILGNSLSGQGKHKEAAASFQNALQYKPYSPEINLNIANALKELKRLKEAAAHYQKALTVNPNYFKALVNYGNLLKETGRLEEASVCCRKAVYL